MRLPDFCSAQLDLQKDEFREPIGGNVLVVVVVVFYMKSKKTLALFLALPLVTVRL